VHISELSDERITHPKQVVREGEDVHLRIIKIEPQRHRLGLSLRQAEDAGEYGYGGYEAWSGGSSYVLGGGGTESAPHDGEEGAPHDGEKGELQEAVPAPENDVEPAADTLHPMPADQAEATAAEPAANGTARVPEH
jgi:transcriptional accessory protein Tex/SPT6